VSDTSNEIIAIPALLDIPAIESAVVTIDAMGCQRDIARKIIDKKADDVLALKRRQGTLRDELELFATEQKARGYADTTISVDATVDGDHGRIETGGHRNTGASKPVASSSFTILAGCRNVTNGRASPGSASSKPPARSTA
jgi:hypothetical protein